MGGFANTFNTPTGIQTQVSGASAPGYGGYGANPYGDMSWLVNLAKRRAQQKIQAGDIANQGAALQLKMAEDARMQHQPNLQVEDPNSPYGANSAYAQGMRYRSAMANLPEPTAAMRATSAVAGMTGQAYGDMNRQMMAANMAQGRGPVSDYSGWTQLVQALNQGGGGAAAEREAGTSRQQMAEQNSPIAQAAAQQAMASRMYPGLAQRLYGQQQGQQRQG